MVRGTPFSNGRLVTISRFGFFLENKVLFEPMHIESFCLEAFRQEDAAGPFEVVQEVWRRLPLAVVERIGPRLMRYLP